MTDSSSDPQETEDGCSETAADIDPASTPIEAYGVTLPVGDQAGNTTSEDVMIRT